jgi:hypothetical protein
MAARPIEQLESDPRWHSNMRPGERSAIDLPLCLISLCASLGSSRGLCADLEVAALLRESQGEVVKVVEASIRALVDGDLNACMAAAGVVKEVRPP